MYFRKSSTLRSIVAAALLVAVISGCASSSASPTASTTSDADGPISVKVPAGVTLTIADDESQVATLMQLSGQQAQLAEKVSYANFNSGPERLQALKAGDVQAAAVGDVPAVLAQFSKDGVENIVATSQPNTIYVTTATNSGIKSWQDLKGKSIGIETGTAQQAVVLRNLKAAGISPKDVKFVNLDVADFVDGLTSHQIDAAPLKEPDRAHYLAQVKSGSVVVLPNAPSASTEISYIYASASALSNPATASALRDFAIHYYRAIQWENTHIQQWETGYLIDNQKLTQASADAVVKGQGTITIPGFTPALIAEQQATVDLLQAAGVFGGGKLNAAEEFDMQFANLNANSPTSSS